MANMHPPHKTPTVVARVKMLILSEPHFGSIVQHSQSGYSKLLVKERLVEDSGLAMEKFGLTLTTEKRD